MIEAYNTHIKEQWEEQLQAQVQRLEEFAGFEPVKYQDSTEHMTRDAILNIEQELDSLYEGVFLSPLQTARARSLERKLDRHGINYQDLKTMQPVNY